MTEPNEVELLPCPFCDGKPYLHTPFKSAPTMNSSERSVQWQINCPECGAKIPHYATESDARAAWNRRVETKNSESDELYVSYKLGLEKGLEINRQKTEEWTEEIETDYSKIFIAHCNDGRKRLVEFVSDSFVVVNGNIRNGIDIFSFIDRYDPLWYKIPTPPLPGKEVKQ